MITKLSLFLLTVAGLCRYSHGQEEEEELGGFYSRVIEKSGVPQNMSTERYQQEQLIRLREVLDKLTSEDEPLDHSRHKRSIEEGFLANINVGFYKQDTLLINKFQSFATTSGEESVTDPAQFMIEKIVEYNDADNVKTLLKFTATRAGITVQSYNAAQTTWTTLTADGNSFANFVQTSDSKLTITDVEMGNNPASVYNFLCITIDFDDGYPRERTDIVMEKDINQPFILEDVHKSILFYFDLDLENNQFTLTPYQLDTTHARDCEFWVADEKLMLGIAQYGNIQTDQPRQKSKIYYQTNPDVPFFEEFISEVDTELFATYKAVRVVPFMMDGQSCVLFVNSWDGINESPIYCYNFQTMNFALKQNVHTFGAQDAAFLTIRDTYPANSFFFLIVCNKVERVGSILSPVSPTVFKRTHGRFIPYQTLSDMEACDNIRSYAMQTDPVSANSNLPNLQTVNLQHFVAVAGDNRIRSYQFDGKHFVPQGSDIVFGSGTPYIPNSLSSVYDLNPTVHEPRLSYRKTNGISVKKPTFQDVSHDLSAQTHNMLEYCLTKSKSRLDTQNPSELYKFFSLAPKVADLATGLHIDDVTFDGTVTVTNTKVETINSTLLKFDVADLQTIDDSYPDRVTDIDNLTTTHVDILDTLTTLIDGSNTVKTDVDNNFAGPIALNNVLGTELAGDKVSLVDEEFYILKDNNNPVTSIDTTDFFSNLCLIKGANVVEAGFLLSKETIFENIVVNEGYDIEKIQDSLVLDYVDKSQDDVILTGEVTFDSANIFKGAFNAETVNSAAFDETTVILRQGDQTLKNLKFGNTAKFNTINLADFNEADLQIVDAALIVEPALTIPQDLTVNSLTVVGEVDAIFKAEDSQGGQVVVDFNDLLNNHMKVAASSIVDVQHQYTKRASVNDITVSDINNSQWPQDYVKIDSGTLDQTNTVTIADTSFTNGITVNDQVTDGTNSLTVDVSTTLPVIPLTSEDSYTITSTKSFGTINLHADGTVNELIQGLSPADLQSRVTTGEKHHSGSITIQDAIASGSHEITTLELLNSGMIKSECGTSCVQNNLVNLFNGKGIKRRATHINNANLVFDRAEFSSNVDTNLLDQINLSTQWVTLDGSDERILNDMSFKGVVEFDADLAQVEAKKIIACKDNAERRIYCKPDLCTTGHSSCEMVNKECLVKNGINDDTLCEEELSENIHYIWENSLKNDEEVTLSRSVYFHAGFKAREVEIRSGTECTLNGVDCLNVATTTHDEEFTGDNHFDGSMHWYQKVVVEDLQVDGTVEGVDIDAMYSDTLFINSADAQDVSNLIFSDKFKADAFNANGIDIASIAANDLTNRATNVLLSGSARSLSSKLVITQPATAASLQVDTFDSVDMNNYHTNKVTIADGQTITSDITVNGDLTFLGAANQGGSTTDDTKVNGLNLFQLQDNLARIDDASLSFNNVDFDAITVKKGINVNNQLIGVSVPTDVVYETANTIAFNANKVFVNADTEVLGDVLLTSSTWKKNDASAAVGSDNLIQFMDDDNLDNLYFASGVTITNEPTITNLNDQSVATRITDVWMNDRDDTINFNTKFSSLTAKSSFIMQSGNEKINAIDITDLNNYVSTTNVPVNTNGPADVTFQAGLTVKNLNVPAATLEDNSVEKAVNIGFTVVKPKDLTSRAIHLDGTNGNLPVQLSIDNIDVNTVQMADGQTSNNVDLSDQALTYVGGKAFPGALTITSDLVVETLSSDSGPDALHFNFPTQRADETHTGVSASNGLLQVNTWGAAKGNAVYNDNNAATISGSKTFSGNVDMTTLSVTGNLNNVPVGSCANPQILLDSPCSGSTPQTISGSWTFNSDVTANTVSLVNLEGENFDALSAKFVYRDGDSVITFTGSNTFTADLEISEDSAFASGKLAFGGDVGNLKTYANSEMTALDMSYASGDTAPDVKAIINEVKKESDRVPEKFLYTSRNEWVQTTNKALAVSITGSMSDSFPLHLLGLEVHHLSQNELIEKTTGKLTMYSIPTDYALHDRNILSSLKDIDVIIENPDEMDIICLHHDDTKRILLVKEFIPSVTASFESMPEPLNFLGAENGFLASMKVDVSSGNVVTSVLQAGKAGETIQDIASVIIGTKKCVAICVGGTRGVSVLCLNDAFKLETRQIIPGTCTQVTATPDVMSSSDVSKAFLAIANNNPAANEKNLRVFKFDNSANSFVIIHEDLAGEDVQMKLFGFIDTSTGSPVERTLLALYPGPNNFVILEYSQSSNTFEFYDMIDHDHDVKDVDFTAVNGIGVELHLLLLEREATFIHTYTNRGFAKFSSYGPTEVVKMHKDVRKIKVSFNFDKKKFVAVHGPTKYENSVLLGYVNKINDVAAVRQEFQDSNNIPPEFVSLDCHTMVANNLKALYSDDTFELDTISDMFIRLMPNDHINYRAMDFPDPVKAILEDARFQTLLSPQQPTSVANIYKYINNVRTPSDASYMGSILLYQEYGSVAYVYSRLLTDSSIFHAISFWTSCEPDATQSTVEQFSGADVDPRVVADSDTLTKHQCGLVHDLAQDLRTRLGALDNKNDAGAIVIHETDSKTSARLGCGYLKKPTTAKIQFLRDHDEAAIGFEPFIQYTI